MDSSDIKLGDLMACETSGLYRTKVGPYMFGHVTQTGINSISNQVNYYIMWDNGNAFWYNREEMEKYKAIIDGFRNS